MNSAVVATVNWGEAYLGLTARTAVLLVLGAIAILVVTDRLPAISPNGPLAELAWSAERQDGFTVLTPRWHDSSAIRRGQLGAALDSVLTRLDLPRPSPLPRILEVRTVDDAARWNGGYAVPGTLIPSGDIVVVGTHMSDVLLRHELAHATLLAAWGPPHDSVEWLGEGLATVAAGCAGYSPRAVAAVLSKHERLPELSRLITDFRAIPNFESYLAAGSVVELLQATGRRHLLSDVWRDGAGALGSLDALEVEWLAFLNSAPPVLWRPMQSCL